MQAVILLAGYGSRLGRDDLAHKSFLPFGNETLLSRHLKSLQALGVAKAVLVLGHNHDAVRDYALGLNLDLPLEFIDNKVYRTTGNTLSLVLGLKRTDQDVVILDGDVYYPQETFLDYVERSHANSFAVVSADINDAECAKVLLKDNGVISAFITKRLLTEQEKTDYKFGGEAIGFFKLNREAASRFTEMYYANEAAYEKTLWEIPFSDFAQSNEIHFWAIDQPGCFEIDTAEDYQEALDWSQAHPGV
ncbi:MAG: NTP transferase domain-containing protein [Candidatus Nitrohelix vancouverensis]|uniref:NTP transferase domain-containing protein n=1 Tax=Candidatus Nitrohelix vancouverensis TaxID=2705534 RepID=A0A7T0C566_9BACT|nr:MAG: NTP transferase domain-containing protein [Candidatus Nitrohelix vancouverensis]